MLVNDILTVECHAADSAVFQLSWRATGFESGDGGGMRQTPGGGKDLWLFNHESRHIRRTEALMGYKRWTISAKYDMPVEWTRPDARPAL